MRFFFSKRYVLILSFAAALVSGCSFDPNVRKQHDFQAGQRFVQKGDYRSAVIEFSNAIRIDPSYADAHLQLARAYVKLQENDQACEEFSDALKLRPDDYEDRIAMTNLLVSSHRFSDARQQIQLLLRTRPDDPAVHAAQSGLLAAQGDIPGAIAEMQKTILLAPNRWEPYLSLALLQLKNGQPSDGEASLTKVVAMDPQAVPARILLGTYYQTNHRFDEAEQQFRAAIAADATNIGPREALAGLFLAENNKPAAQAILLQAKHDLPHSPEAFLALSNFYFAYGDVDKAVAEYAALYQDQPKDLQIEKKYIQLLIQVKRYDEASRLTGQILKADPGDDDALLYRSQMQISQGDVTDAAQTLQNVVRSAPNNSEAHYVFGVALQKQGFPQRAEEEWHQALSIDPNLLDAERALADTALQQNDMNALQDAANQLIRLQSDQPEGYSLRALASMNLGRYDDAERDVQRAISIAPQSAYGYVEMGNLRLLQKQYPQASAAYQNALSRNPGSMDALRGLVNVDLAEKQLDQAVFLVKEQIAKAPGNSGFYSLLGTVLTRKNDFDAAEVAITKATTLDPHNADAWTQLCELQASEGKLDKAIATDQQALKMLGRQTGLYLLLGSFYESTSSWKNAEDAYQTALTLSPMNPVASNDLARTILHSGGDFDAALALAQTAHRGLPDSPGVVDTLAWIYYQKGAYSLAVTYLQQALSLQQQSKMPDNPDIYYHLGMAYEKTKQPALARQQFEHVLKIAPSYRSASAIRSELTHLQS